MMVSNGNVTALAAGLVAEGLVERRAEAADRRIQRLCLTRNGRRAFEIQSGEHEKWITELFARIPSNDRATLHRLLGVLKSGVRQALRRQVDEPDHLQGPRPGRCAIVRSSGERAMTELTVLQPPGWPSPKGYSNGVAGTGRVAMIGGQIGWDEQGKFPEGFVAQVAQAPRNVITVVREACGGPEHIARLTWYVVDIETYRSSLPRLGAAYRDTLGRWYSAMTLVQVAALVEREALVEIEATAILPN